MDNSLVLQVRNTLVHKIASVLILVVMDNSLVPLKNAVKSVFDKS